MSAYGAFEVVGLRKRGGRSLKLWSREPLDGYAGNERDVLKYRYCSKVHKQQDRKIHQTFTTFFYHIAYDKGGSGELFNGSWDVNRKLLIRDAQLNRRKDHFTTIVTLKRNHGRPSQLHLTAIVVLHCFIKIKSQRNLGKKQSLLG